MVEGLVIVSSILMALAADALWDLRRDREEEQELLASLEAEFTANLDSLENTTRIVEQTREATSELTSLRSEALGALSEEEARDLLRRLTGASSYHPADGVRQAVLASGSLSLLRSRELRAALGGLQGLYADLGEEVTRSFALRDLAVQSLPPGTMTRLHTPPITPDQDEGAAAQLARIRLDAALVDQFVWRSANDSRYLIELEALRREYERIIGLIVESPD